MIQRELTMTVICQAPCDNQYGAWRTQCPVCGRQTPKKAHEAATKQPTTRSVRAVVQRVREPHPSACIFCHRRGAKETCAHCDERIHHNCKGLHTEECKRFQVGRQAELAKVTHDSI